MADDVDALVAEVQGIVDLSPAAALRALNRRHRQMVARGHSLQASISFGVTVAGDLSYAFPASPQVIELREVYVDGVPFGKVKRNDWYSYSQGVFVWEGPTGLWFAEEDGDLILTPPPTTAGLAIVGLAVVMPDDLVAGQPVTALKVDTDFFDALVNGAAATELLRIGEGDPASLEATFTAACEELRARVRRRMRGSGPTQIRVQGLNA